MPCLVATRAVTLALPLALARIARLPALAPLPLNGLINAVGRPSGGAARNVQTAIG
jgi:hypothetical protein